MNAFLIEVLNNEPLGEGCLLTESGDYLLTEDGDKILLEDDEQDG